jgi:hypothetical protein
MLALFKVTEFLEIIHRLFFDKKDNIFNQKIDDG